MVAAEDELHFCWDDRKAAANVEKHGVCFQTATYVFDDQMRLEHEDVFAEGEYRNIVIGRVEDVLLTVVYSLPKMTCTASSLPARLPPMSAKVMSETSFTRKRGAPSRLSDKERARLKNVSDAEAQARALKDPDNPPLNEEQLKRLTLAREVRLIREKTGLSQPQFAARFHIGLARLRDFEQARSEPDFIVRVFLRMIHEDQAKADRLVRIVERHGALV